MAKPQALTVFATSAFVVFVLSWPTSYALSAPNDHAAVAPVPEQLPIGWSNPQLKETTPTSLPEDGAVLTLEGTATFSLSWIPNIATSNFFVEFVRNYGTAGSTSGSIRIEMWATGNAFLLPGQTPAWKKVVGTFQLNPLPGGYQYSNVNSGTLTESVSPENQAYIQLVLFEYVPSDPRVWVPHSVSNLGNWSQPTTQKYSLAVSRAGTGDGSVSSNPIGISCGADCSEDFASGTSVSLSATPQSDSTFDGWSGACSGTGACTVSMTTSRSVTATFTQDQVPPSSYLLSVTRNGTGSGTVISSPVGINCGAVCSSSFDAGSAVTLSATPAVGSTFTSWSGNCPGTGACVLTLSSNTSVLATFSAAPSGACTATPATFCTQNKRFEINISATDQRTGKTDSGFVMLSTDIYGMFAFPNIAGNTTDPQIFVKVLDGRPVNGKWWVFCSTLTDVEFRLIVTDKQTGTQKPYFKPAGGTSAIFDTSAF